MRLDLILYSVLLAAALGLAYRASLKDESVEDSEVAVVSINPASVKALRYRDSEHLVNVEKLDGTQRFLVNYEVLKLPELKPLEGAEGDDAEEDGHDHGDEMDPHAADAKDAMPKPEAPAKPLPPKEAFLADDALDGMLKDANPIYASRVFDEVGEEKLKEFGLGPGAAELSFEREGAAPIRLLIGEKNFGSESRFVKVADDKQNRVYVIDGELIGALKKAKARLFEKGFLSASLDDYEAVNIQAQGKKAIVLKPERDAGGEVKDWKDAEGNAQGQSVNYKNWLAKVDQVVITKYLDLPASSLGTPIASLTFQSKKGEAEQVELYKMEGKAGGGAAASNSAALDPAQDPAVAPADGAAPVDPLESEDPANAQSPSQGASSQTKAPGGEKTSYVLFFPKLKLVGEVSEARMVTVEKDLEKLLVEP